MWPFGSQQEKLNAKLFEEKLYANAVDELDRGHVRHGLWAKAFAESDGSEARARSRYLKSRVSMLRAEVGAAIEFSDAIKRSEALERSKAAAIPPPPPTPKPSEGSSWIPALFVMGSIGSGIFSYCSRVPIQPPAEALVVQPSAIKTPQTAVPRVAAKAESNEKPQKRVNANDDMRLCLNLKSDAEIMKCGTKSK